jgi:hypothetical protein
MSKPSCHCEYHYDVEEDEPCFTKPETKAQKDMYDMLAELFMADEPQEQDFAFIVIAGYVIREPDAQAFLKEHQTIAIYLRTLTDDLMNKRTHLLSTCWDLSAVLSRI